MKRVVWSLRSPRSCGGWLLFCRRMKGISGDEGDDSRIQGVGGGAAACDFGPAEVGQQAHGLARRFRISWAKAATVDLCNEPMTERNPVSYPINPLGHRLQQ